MMKSKVKRQNPKVQKKLLLGFEKYLKGTMFTF